MRHLRTKLPTASCVSARCHCIGVPRRGNLASGAQRPAKQVKFAPREYLSNRCLMFGNPDPTVARLLRDDTFCGLQELDADFASGQCHVLFRSLRDLRSFHLCEPSQLRDFASMSMNPRLEPTATPFQHQTVYRTAHEWRRVVRLLRLQVRRRRCASEGRPAFRVPDGR